jgi:hypothetical protein
MLMNAEAVGRGAAHGAGALNRHGWYGFAWKRSTRSQSIQRELEMVTTESVLKRYRSGETVRLGEGVSLSQEGLLVDGEQVGLNTVQPLRVDDRGNVVISRIGARESWLVVPTSSVDNVGMMLEAVNQLVKDVPYLERRSVTGWPPGSVGDVSARIGYDMRELMIAGYSWKEIHSVLHGGRTLEELLERNPQKGRSGKRKV